jgi:hypothetical protein
MPKRRSRPRSAPWLKAPVDQDDLQAALELYRSGDLRDKPLRHAAEGTPGRTLLVVMDRSPEAAEVRDHFDWLFASLGECSAWDLHPNAPFCLIVSAPGVFRCVLCESIRGLICEGFPQLLAPLLLKQSPTTLIPAFNAQLRVILESQIEQLLHGQLPDPGAYPFVSAAPTGRRLECCCNTYLFSQKDEQNLRTLLRFGLPESDSMARVAPEHRQVDRTLWRQEDGSLHCRLELAGGDALGLTLSPDKWCQLNAGVRMAGPLNSSSRLM